MPDLTAKRTLVKSPPELWSELSEVERLARHLGAFGEIKITKLEPEHTVAWEGEGARGTVSIEPSGWGTKVTLTARLGEGEGGEPSADLEEAPAAEPAAGGGVHDEVGGGEPEAAEPVVDEASSFEAPDVVVEAEPVDDDPVVEDPVVVEAASVDDEPVVEEPVAAAPEVVEPIQSKPRRRRSFLAWLFRPRTSAQVTDPPVVTPAEPVVEEPAEEEPLVEEPLVEEVVVEEAAPPAEAPLFESPLSEAPPFEPPLSEAPLFEPPLSEAPPAESVPASEQHPLMAEETPPVSQESDEVSEPPPLADELAAIEQASPRPGLDAERAQAILDEALDALGSAHHRPFSRG